MNRALLLALRGLALGREVEIDGVRLVVPRGVLDPLLFRTGAWFAREVAASARPGERLLDLGCGSGVVGALAARRGARVTASDVDPRAVEAARRNGIADARRSDLFEALAGERYDRICWNPPYLPGPWERRPYGRALYGGADLGLVRRFAAEAPAHLLPGGEVWVAWSDRAPPAAGVLGPAFARRRAEPVEDERLELWIAAP